jgi:hypothetical protein
MVMTGARKMELQVCELKLNVGLDITVFSYKIGFLQKGMKIQACKVSIHAGLDSR